jgi:CRISPR-associated endonuclease/helicase Cas3
LPELPKELWSREELTGALKSMLQEFIQFGSDLTWEQKKLIAAVKATVIAADLSGSALPSC